MRVVTIEVLEEQLRDYVALAASGERVLVSDRGVVVAELRPQRTVQVPTGDEPAIERGIREGLITPPMCPRRGAPPRGVPLCTLEELLEELAGDREDR